MPTVATKNGGPVDIMSTLHHGLLVDPGSSTAIAEACLKILTNSQLWDEMSRNGTYSPASPSSCCSVQSCSSVSCGIPQVLLLVTRNLCHYVVLRKLTKWLSR